MWANTKEDSRKPAILKIFTLDTKKDYICQIKAVQALTLAFTHQATKRAKNAKKTGKFSRFWFFSLLAGQIKGTY